VYNISSRDLIKLCNNLRINLKRKKNLCVKNIAVLPILDACRRYIIRVDFFSTKGIRFLLVNCCLIFYIIIKNGIFYDLYIKKKKN
jgi:hypothetical protein